MSTVPTYVPHYTVNDYEQWSGDWELWQGTAVAMTPSSFGRHQFVLVNLASELRSALRDTDWHVLVEIDWRISDSTVVRPDALVLSGSVPDRHVEETPVLIGEILSESTAEKDRTAKLALYQAKGVQNYWLIDPDQEAVDCFVLGDQQRYATMPSDRHVCFAGPTGEKIEIEVARLFD